jgi:hypothetical protein
MTEEFSHLARVRLVSTERKAEITELLKSRYTLDEDPNSLFLWDAEISNDLLDSHFTHMDEKTLRNYAAETEEGVAFLKGHNWKELPIGYSVSGTFDETGTKQRVVSGFYTVRGLPETDDLIKRMVSGLLRDVSVGFHGGTMRCDICQQDFWDCRHYPGLKYEEKKGDTVTTLLATYTIEDAHLSEVSGVFDGSTPEAMILKAQRGAKSGDLTLQQIQQLEQRYRISLPDKKIFSVPPVPKGEAKMNEKQLARLKEIVIASGVVPEDARENIDEETLLVFADKLVSRIKTLEPQAADGVRYREDLVKEALAEGVRAQGADFDATLYEATLKASPLTVVKRMRDDWKKFADAALKGGRQSVDGDETHTKAPASLIPDGAYV